MSQFSNVLQPHDSASARGGPRIPPGSSSEEDIDLIFNDRIEDKVKNLPWVVLIRDEKKAR